jgi:hypothetical protein
MRAFMMHAFSGHPLHVLAAAYSFTSHMRVMMHVFSEHPLHCMFVLMPVSGLQTVGFARESRNGNFLCKAH